MAQENKKKNAKKPSPRRSALSRFGSVVKWMFILGIIGVLFAGGAVAGYVASIVKDEPVRSEEMIQQQVSQNAITGFAYFRDGAPIGQLRTEEDRRLIEFNDIPQLIIDAVLAIEDNNFNEHNGVDFKGTLRAVKQKLLNESVQTGGSTLTQQLARRVFLNLDRTEDRKVKEILLSLRLERFLTKQEILTAYLNKVPFGNGSNGYNVFGIKAAAKGIFGLDDLDKLNVAQAAYLAGLPQLPSAYSAFNGIGEFNEKAFNRAMDRQHLVLRRMLEENKITTSQYDEALKFDIKSSLAPHTKKAYATYPYLMMETERKASEILLSLNEEKNGTTDANSTTDNAVLLEEARQQLMTGGYRVYTTIDKKVYNAMHSVSEDSNNFTKDSKTKGMEQTAGMLIDNKTGAILGMIEGRDFNIEQMNYATQMIRQPGSTMKPISAYLPALDAGLIQPAGIVDDAPIILKDGGKGFHIPKNANNRYQGLVTARYALNKSLNLPALKLFNEKVGIEKSWAFTKKLGITTLTDDDYSAQTGVIGGLKYGVSVEELTNAYSAIGNQGAFNDAYMIEKIVNSEGKIIYQHKVNPEQVFSKQTAYLMTDMLRTVITEGTASTVKRAYKHSKEIPIVGKTGSTQNYGDVWFMGYTPDVTLGMWVGYKEQINTLTGDTQKRQAQTLWAKVLNAVIDKQPELFVTDKFAQPEGIIKKTVSAYSGKLPTSLTDKFTTDIFNTKYVPKESDDGISKAKYITYKGVNYIPLEGTPEEFLKEKIVVKREKPIQELVKELLAAFPKMKDHKSLEYYMPADAKTDFPTEVDPRVDDGASPAAPGNVNVSYSTGKAVISFSASSSADVVGYRLYRSLNGGSFQKQSILMADENKVFTPGTPASANATFYVTAVDVAGNETASGSVAGGITPTPEATPTPDQQPGTEPPTEPETTPGDIIEDPGNILPLPTETPAGGGNSTGGSNNPTAGNNAGTR
ncbi:MULTISPECIES: transglycosylase domain-containing protein [Paenibacillus]|uniref:Carboxypeptidase n=1 Tax=Paenibacillus odorifer TaxID=189426 RepID=A0A1R0X187_9BACL|nr:MULTISPECIES: transglycosylase domain-containing protein [Paenibacillus]ETT49395.1 penicillin-binding protein 1A [Paenibacillus sp. FSL H8-237]MEC0130612.1 transglycosylase domain-containing protein [Paenibacillus odorifer]MEC0220822.1 transglycosylase domain-containing protein [Paenibacillus odorifer]OMD26406.1 carboxypeptidase [Paenibacillus odorifer]OME32427.1 carboxypeptidase [Paenibacillus odorifer]